MMLASLDTQTGLHCLTNILVLLTLEYGLEIVTESFSPLNLDYTISLVKV